MSIQKPFNLNIKGTTIDGNEKNIIRWKVTGNISVAFEIEILNNLDNSLAFKLDKFNSFATSYHLPENSLENGKEYKIRIRVWNENDQSAISDFEIFQTSSRPIITIDEIGTVANQSNMFTATYFQAESVGMRSYIVYLYNSNQTRINQSEIKTSQPLSHIFSNLQSQESYYIEFQATSNRGLVGTSGRIAFNVLYTQPQVSLDLMAENVDNAGIRLMWNVIQIIGKSECEELTYIDNEKVNLTDGCVVKFDEGFSIFKDFTLKLWIEDVIPYTNLLEFDGENGKIAIQYWTEDSSFHLFKIIGSISTHWKSNEIIGSSFFVCVQQSGDNMNIISEVISE